MIRTLALVGLSLFSLDALAVTNTALLSRVTCDFAYYGHGEALLVQADGKVIVGGSFSHVNGQRRENLARLTPAGSLDETFLAETDDWVDTIVADGSHIYVAGTFTYVNGTSYVGVVRLNGTDGSIDTTWDAGVDGWVYAVAVDATHVYLGGSFSTVGGEAIPYLARVDKATGAVDTNWVPTPNSAIYAIQAADSGVYAGGVFTMMGTNNASYLARVDKVTGQMDTTWLGSTPDTVNDLLVDAGKLYVGWDAEGAGFYLTAQTNFGLVRFDADTGALDTNWNPRVVGPVYRIAVDTTRVYAAGAFSRVSGAVKRSVVRLDKGTGAADLAWCPDTSEYACNVAPASAGVYVSGGLRRIGASVVSGIARLHLTTGEADPMFRAYCETSAEIIATALQPDGKVLVGGQFYRAGNEFRDYLARFESDGTVDPNWVPNPDFYVLDVAVDGSNIYAAGAFSQIGGMSRVGIARLNDTDGAADPAWESPLGGLPIYISHRAETPRDRSVPVCRTSERRSVGLNVVRAIAQDEAAVYIGGVFFSGGIHPQFGLAKLSKSNGSLISEFAPELWDGYVYSLALDGNRLYAGGNFEWIGGEIRNGLACLNTTDGTADPAWDPQPDGIVSVLKVHGGHVYVSGGFNDIGGLSNTYGLVRFSTATGAVDPAWLPLVPPVTFGVARSNRGMPWVGVEDLAFSGSHAILSGWFQGIGAATDTWYLGRVSLTDGAPDPEWVPMPDYVCGRAVADGQALYVFGQFYQMADQPRLGFAKLFLEAPAAPTPVAASKTYSDRVVVSWAACPGAEVFEVWRGDSNQVGTATLLAGSLTSTNYNDTNTIMGARHYYWIRGTNGLGAGALAGPDRGWRRSPSALCGTIGDYNGDGASDLAVFDEARALWYAYSLAGLGGIIAWDFAWGSAGNVTVPGDYDGDRISDWGIYQPDANAWYVLANTGELLAWNVLWGGLGYTTVPGDYDGDGASDLAVYNPADGSWFIWSLAHGRLNAPLWGWADGTPVPGDYDGDGASDLAVFDRQGPYWYIWSLTRGMIVWDIPWGWTGATPVSGDFDGDGTSDLALYNGETGCWFVYSLADGGSVLAWDVPWGMAGLIPVPGDFDGDGASDWAVYNPLNGKWYIRKSPDGQALAWEYPFGGAGFMPVTAAGR